MLYESNTKNPKLDPELFRSPTAEYRATPFWAWNCDLEKEELLRQIDIFKEMGLGGFHMHCRAGMSTTYLSEEFMDLVKACTDHAEKKQMLAWLYDEDKWPSGFAGGYVTKDEQFRMRYVAFSCDPAYPVRPSTVILGRFDIQLDESGALASYQRLKEGEDAKGVAWTVYREIAEDSAWYNNQAYIDTLNPKAAERFLQVTHEAYASKVGYAFGKTIPAIFTDEPQFRYKQTLAFADSRQEVKLPWTDDLPESFFKEYGEDLVEHLPELLWDLAGGKVSLIRYQYHDHVAERFTKGFVDPCGEWCREHGIELTGHMMNEHTLESQTASLGDCMRSYRAFGIPGIDMLCAYFEFTTAKQCQSAVHQYGRPGMMSELYGVTGWDFDFRGHKLHGDWQAALGVTVRVPHLSWVSMKGMAKRDYPASISYQSPWYREYGYIEDHFARVNTALTRGKPCVRIAVVHPVESFWLHFGPNEQTALARERLNTNFMNVTDWLLRGNLDFDYLSESLLPEQCAKGTNPLQVGEMKYDVVIVPECETLRSTTLERLEDFRKAGGRLLFMGDAPQYENARPSQRGKALFDHSESIAFSKGALLSALEAERTVDIRDNANGKYTRDLIHQLRRDGDGRWLFVAHCQEPYNKDVARPMSVRIKIKGCCHPELWDTQTGEVRSIPYRAEKNATYIYTDLYDYDSLLLFLRDSEMPEEIPAAEKATREELAELPDLVEYTISEPNVLLLDMPRYAVDDKALSRPEQTLRADLAIRRSLGMPKPEAQPWVVPNTPAEHTVTMEFTVNSEIEYPDPMLALEDAEVAEITFNGEPVAFCDKGYYTDRSIRCTALPALKKGENRLRVRIPYGGRTSCENLYLLGWFGVRVEGRRLTVTDLPQRLGFGDLTYQGLPFYGGVVSYQLPITLEREGAVSLRIPHYTAAVNTVEVDGERRATVAYPPYDGELGVLAKGSHTVTVNTYVSRRNCFGDVHNADEKYQWQGPAAWMTSESLWTYEYRLRRTGLLTKPQIFQK